MAKIKAIFSPKMHTIFVFLMLFTRMGHGEWYSSLGHMEDLISEELKLILSLDDFISEREEELCRIKEMAKKMKLQAEEAGNDVEKYLGHPVNQFLLVKRLAEEWDNIESLIRNGTAHDFLNMLTKKRSTLPNDEDLKETTKALMRLQDTYELDTHDLAEGMIRNSSAGHRLSAHDCFTVGVTAYQEQDYYHSVLWMTEANSKIEKGDISHSRFDVLDHLAHSHSQLENFTEALRLTEQLLEIQPAHERIQENHNQLKKILESEKQNGDELRKDSSKKIFKRKITPETDLYERLCREYGEPLPPKVEKELKCYFWNNNHPLLKLQPFKMEEMWTSTHIVRFYDILTDNEIEVIKAMAKPRLNRAPVFDGNTGATRSSHFRVSQNAWLGDEENMIVERISQRISAITGLTMDTAELLQIGNYGVGGHYVPHHDFLFRGGKKPFEERMGDRIATMLFYLTDVEHGGATVFLHPRIAAKPIKGSAVFWYNLLASGNGDMRTLHAACPVLTGVKWVANKWIHERGQEFRKPCLKEENRDNRIF